MSSKIESDVTLTLRAAGCVFAEDEARLLISAVHTRAELSQLVDRRAAGEPLEQILGWAEFRGLRIVVKPGVFVPRTRTGFLVEQAVSVAPPSRAVVVDLCCGSGAVGAALLAVLDRVELYAADIDPAAVRCARVNIPVAAGLVCEGDLYEPLPASVRGRIDVLVANAPYVPTGEVALMPPEARLHEARVALDGGRDGLDVVRRVAAGASEWLVAGGSLLVETSREQARLVATEFTGCGLVARIARSEDYDATVVLGTWTGPAW